MNQLSSRQQQILHAIIQEYMKNASEVGSAFLVDEYDLDVSPATVRSEMGMLADRGYLAKSHVSSGRYPTDLAIRFYIKNFANKSGRNIVNVVKVKQEIYRQRFDKQALINEVLELLSEYAKATSFVSNDLGVQYQGLSWIFEYEELRQVAIIERILDLVEDEHLLYKIVEKYRSDNISVLVGSELGVKDMENCALVFGMLPMIYDNNTVFGVIGSKRLNYGEVIPLLRHVQYSVREVLNGWV